MKVLPALTAAFLFAASTQTSQAMPCGQYGQLVKNSMNNPAILPMQKQCYVAMAEYTCEECNGNMACMQSRGEIGPEESARIMPQLPECDDLMRLARGFMPKRRLRSHAMPAEVSCNAAELGRMVDAQLPPVTDPAQVIAQGMQKRCFVGIAMDMCEPCDGNTACMQARGQQGGPALMQSTPECADLMRLARGFMPKRRLKRLIALRKGKKGKELKAGMKKKVDDKGNIYTGYFDQQGMLTVGTIEYTNGDFLKGKWNGEDGFVKGSAIFVQERPAFRVPSMAHTFKGKFQGRYGTGTIKFANGDVYRGGVAKDTHYPESDFVKSREVNFRKQGKGVYVTAEGVRYIGVFGTQNGHYIAGGNLGGGEGKIIYPNGEVYKGKWGYYDYQGGSMEPLYYGTMTFPNGDVSKGEWEYGSLISGCGIRHGFKKCKSRNSNIKKKQF